MKRRWFVLVILVAWLPFFIAAWDNTLPADSSQWNNAAGYIRANNNALEVVLGIDLSMEGSAYPWYQPTAPTTKADGSTALDATDNGFLWVDSDTRILYTYIHGTGFRGIDAIPAVVTFTAADATPTVVLSSLFTTNATGVTITDFDDGTDGKTIVVLSKGATVYDTTTGQDADHNLDGSSANITTASGDITVWRNEGGTTWHLVRWNDASFDNGATIALQTYVQSYVDARALKSVNVTVFTTSMTAASDFQTLDLSGTVGSNVAMVHLLVNVGAAADNVYVVKAKDLSSDTFTDWYNTGEQTGAGVVQGEAAVATLGHVTLLTDSSGMLEHGFTDNSTTITVTLLSWQAAL